MIISKTKDNIIDNRKDGRLIENIFDYNSENNQSSIKMLISKIPEGCNEILHYHKNSIEIFYCLTDAEIIINDETIYLSKGDSIMLEPEDKHRIKATKPMELLVIQNPNINDKTIIQ